MAQENKSTKSEKLQPQVVSIPRVVCVYGIIIMILSGIVIGLSVVELVFGSLKGSSLALDSGVIHFVFALAYFLIGKGLRKGRRSAVTAMSILAAFGGIMLVFYVAIGESLLFVTILLAIVCAIYAPPLISAYRNWNQFH